MFAVVDIAGQQFNVEENSKYYVPKLEAEVDKEITFDKVLLLNDGKKTQIGAPSLEGIKVTAKVLEHLKDDKVIVFKKKRRKSYKVKKGHRQQLTQIEVTKIG
ncbi:MAG: 50S ribosomal protein L21 [Melioribacteraceae bacterium]|nr:50S ribosomal protein L21 [Melioribacteraceae bacterium]